MMIDVPGEVFEEAEAFFNVLRITSDKRVTAKAKGWLGEKALQLALEDLGIENIQLPDRLGNVDAETSGCTFECKNWKREARDWQVKKVIDQAAPRQDSRKHFLSATFEMGPIDDEGRVSILRYPFVHSRRTLIKAAKCLKTQLATIFFRSFANVSVKGLVWRVRCGFRRFVGCVYPRFGRFFSCFDAVFVHLPHAIKETLPLLDDLLFGSGFGAESLVGSIGLIIIVVIVLKVLGELGGG